MKMKPEEMYAKMSPWRLFFVVAMPGMISMFAMSVYSIIEGIFIGQTLGEGAFAAVNIAMPLVMINFSLADLIGVGSSAPISISLGRGDNKNANNIFSASVIMIFLAAVLMGCIMFFAAEPLSRMMGADDALLLTSVRYLRTCAALGPLATIFFAMDNYLKISGFVKTSMLINVGSNLLTIGLLAFFLLVCGMDVVGSALAASLSMCVCAIIALVPFVMKKAILKFTRPHFSLSMIRQIAACGSPVFLNNVSGRITSILMNISLMTLGVGALGNGGGQTAVAVYAVLMYASDLCWPLLYGIADSIAPSLGYNWGAKNYGRVKKIAGCAYIGTAIIGLVSTSILFFFPDVIASWFVRAEDAKLLEIATGAIRLFCFAYLFRWVGVTTQSYLSAIGKPARAALISVGTAFVFPVALLGALWYFGLDGIWFNFVGVNIFAAALSAVLLIYLSREIKKRESATTVDVYIAALPEGCEIGVLSDKARQEEIDAVSNERVKREKYFGWKLLAYALENSFGPREWNIKKESFGGISANGAYLSLSHSNGAIAVAVSSAPVGVDIESINMPRAERFAERIMTERELAAYQALPEEKRAEQLIGIWTAKEAIFKSRGEGEFVPDRVDTDAPHKTATVGIGSARYAWSVATATPSAIRVFDGIDLTKVK